MQAEGQQSDTRGAVRGVDDKSARRIEREFAGSSRA